MSQCTSCGGTGHYTVVDGNVDRQAHGWDGSGSHRQWCEPCKGSGRTFTCLGCKRSVAEPDMGPAARCKACEARRPDPCRMAGEGCKLPEGHRGRHRTT